MKIHSLILIPLLLSFLFGCQKNEQQNIDKTNSKMQGPSDSGGGDTCNGRVIESYRVDISNLPEFVEFLNPILEKLTTSSSQRSSSPFEFSAKSKNWYIIDCKLQDIPADRKGLYVETYQTAIHTAREIFIDSSSYNKMSKEEKAKLLLHEIVMAHYLVKYLSLEQICKMSNSCNSDFLKVSGWKIFRPEIYRPLNEEDHQKIRGVVAWIWSQKDVLNKEAFSTLLKNNDFDKRFPIFSDLDEYKSKEIRVGADVLARMFKKYQWTNTFPTFCSFNSVTNLSESICHVDVQSEIRNVNVAENVSLKHLTIKIKVSRNSDGHIFEQDFLYPLDDSLMITFHMNKIGNVLNTATFGVPASWPNQYGVNLVEGLKSQMLFMFLNVSDQKNPEIYQMYYQTYVWYSFEDVFVEKDGLRYKETYGYPSLIEKESEVLFIEKELPFNFNGGLVTGRVFLKSILAPH